MRLMVFKIILAAFSSIRDVANGPNGDIFVVLNNPGTVLRLTPIIEDDGF
jgi:hypothetical protein